MYFDWVVCGGSFPQSYAPNWDGGVAQVVGFATNASLDPLFDGGVTSREIANQRVAVATLMTLPVALTASFSTLSPLPLAPYLPLLACLAPRHQRPRSMPAQVPLPATRQQVDEGLQLRTRVFNPWL